MEGDHDKSPVRGDPRTKKIEEALDEVRPYLQADGGDVELVGIEDNIVKVRLKGMCLGCPMSQMTLTQGVEKAVKQKVPDIERVEQVE